MRKRSFGFLSALLMASMVMTPLQNVQAAGSENVANNNLVINEINSQPDDWVELKNVGSEPMDISGYEIRDNSNDHRWRFAEGTTITAGDHIVVDEQTMGLQYEKRGEFKPGTYDIGLGGGDSVRLYDKDGNLIDQYTWTEHASYKGDAAKASYGRYPDGTGEFILMRETKGVENKKLPSPVVINEVQSNDPNKGPDWVELANPTEEEIDISGLVLKDDDDTHGYTIPDGTKIAAKGFLVIDENAFDFGLGKGDAVRLFEDGELIASTTWPAGSHTSPTWGLYPDMNGTEYRNTKEETPGAANIFEEVSTVETIDWPGSNEVKVFDMTATFLEDSSGLDFFNGQLYAIDNGTGKFWVMDVAKDGSLNFAKGFENGKRVRYQKDAQNPSAAGPDTEGITVDGKGMVYVASERDNSAKGVNYDTILQVNPKEEGTDLVALKEWNLTDSLPTVSANMGIEAIEWVSNQDVNGVLFDQNTKAPFDAANYPNAMADGVFFVALEDNGHVYAYVLNQDKTVVQIADINSKLGGAMGLDYDTYEKVLWVAADNGYGNRSAKITLTGKEEVGIVHVNPASGLDVGANFEGFAIADASYTRNGQRPVYHFLDGVKSGALVIGSMNCDYKESNPDNGGQTPTPEKPDQGSTQQKPVSGGSTQQKQNVVVLKTGTKIKVSSAWYKVTGSKKVEYIKPSVKKASVVIPATVTIKGVKYQVTSISAKAFKKNKKLKKVVIPSTVTKIGKEAFYGCKNLKNITIKTSKLNTKRIGSKAFRGVNARAKVKVPKSKYKAYKKLLVKKGLNKKAKIRK